MNNNRIVAVLLARLILGFIFFMQGFGKVFTFGMVDVYNKFFAVFETTLPKFLTYFTAYYTSYVEWIGGFLLIIGFKTKYVLYALGLVLVMVTFGHGLIEPIWDLSHIMYRTILLITLLLLPPEWDRLSIDYWMRKPKK